MPATPIFTLSSLFTAFHYAIFIILLRLITIIATFHCPDTPFDFRTLLLCFCHFDAHAMSLSPSAALFAYAFAALCRRFRYCWFSLLPDALLLVITLLLPPSERRLFYAFTRAHAAPDCRPLGAAAMLLVFINTPSFSPADASFRQRHYARPAIAAIFCRYFFATPALTAADITISPA